MCEWKRGALEYHSWIKERGSAVPVAPSVFLNGMETGGCQWHENAEQ